MGRQRTRQGQHVFCRITGYSITRILALALFYVYVATANAQTADETPLAAILEITYAGVEIQRDETEAWLPLSQGALMAVGTGDRIRTDETGRALISTVDRAIESLILPNSLINIDQLFLRNQDTYVFPQLTITVVEGEVATQVVFNRSEQDGISLSLISKDDSVDISTSPIGDVVGNNTLILFESSDELGTTYSILGDGVAVYSLQPHNISGITAPTAVYTFPVRALEADGSLSPSIGRHWNVLEVALPSNPAQLQGQIFGCVGSVMTESGENLNARIGPSTAYAQYGQFPNETDVQVMGIVESGGWYRVQYKSGFGWVERLAVVLDDAECLLPTLPDDTFDLPTRIIDSTALELELLEPFYGTPEYDPIFYRFTD